MAPLFYQQFSYNRGSDSMVSTTNHRFLLHFLAALIGNLTLILVIFTTQTIRKMTISVFIASLALSDFLVGVIIIPVKLKKAYHNLYFCDTISLCRVYITTDNILFAASITNLFILTIDRYVVRYMFHCPLHSFV